MNMEYEVISMLARARLYIKDRRPYETNTLEILQDLIDVAEGARRAKLINWHPPKKQKIYGYKKFTRERWRTRMPRKQSRIIRVRSAGVISTTTRRSKIISTNAVHEGLKSSVENATEDSSAISATNSWSEFSNVVNRFHHCNCSNDW